MTSYRSLKRIALSSALLCLVSSVSPVSAIHKSSEYHPSAKCKRTTWASTDKCKEPAVAKTDAPKDLKVEIERLASLIASTGAALKSEHAAWAKQASRDYQRDMREYEASKSKLRECFKKIGLNYDTYSGGGIPKKCEEFWTLPPGRHQFMLVTKRVAWAQAWLDLSTLAKTFPQHIQPSVLPMLLNANENARACVSDQKCLPEGMSAWAP